MRIISRDLKLYLHRRRSKLEIRRIVSRDKKKRANRAKSAFGQNMPKSSSHGIIRLKLPRVLCLTKNYEHVMSFFRELREAVLQAPRRRITVDFTTVKEINPRASLLLAAELDRWQRLHNIRLTVQRLKKWDAEVRRLLYEKGLFDLLQTSNIPKRFLDSAPNIEYIKFETQNFTDGPSAKILRENIEKKIGKIKAKGLMFKGISEAMINVVQHAYPSDAKYEYEPIHNQWWMSGAVDHHERKYSVVLVDQGVGIPSTLPATHSMEKVQDLLDKLGLRDVDASRIKAAMTLGRSQTGQTHRGKGLKDIRKIVAENKDGILRILSGKGEYIYYSNGKEELINHKHSVGGTIIEWIVSF